MRIEYTSREMGRRLEAKNFLNISRVVATQLNAELTKQLVITDPYRIKVTTD